MFAYTELLADTFVEPPKFAGGDDFGAGGLAELADAVAEITRAEEQPVITGQGGDFFDDFEAPAPSREIHPHAV